MAHSKVIKQGDDGEKHESGWTYADEDLVTSLGEHPIETRSKALKLVEELKQALHEGDYPLALALTQNLRRLLIPMDTRRASSG